MEKKRICLFCKNFYEWRDVEPVDKQGIKYGSNSGHCMYDDAEEKEQFETDFVLVKWNSSCDKFDSIFPQLDKKKERNSERK